MARRKTICIKQAFGWTAQKPRIYGRSAMARNVHCFVEATKAIPKMKFVKEQVIALVHQSTTWTVRCEHGTDGMIGKAARCRRRFSYRVIRE